MCNGVCNGACRGAVGGTGFTQLSLEIPNISLGLPPPQPLSPLLEPHVSAVPSGGLAHMSLDIPDVASGHLHLSVGDADFSDGGLDLDSSYESDFIPPGQGELQEHDWFGGGIAGAGGDGDGSGDDDDDDDDEDDDDDDDDDNDDKDDYS